MFFFFGHLRKRIETHKHSLYRPFRTHDDLQATQTVSFERDPLNGSSWEGFCSSRALQGAPQTPQKLGSFSGKLQWSRIWPGTTVL